MFVLYLFGGFGIVMIIALFFMGIGLFIMYILTYIFNAWDDADEEIVHPEWNKIIKRIRRMKCRK